MAVVIGEASVRIRGDADEGEIRSEVEPAVAGALESAGEAGADAFSAKMAAGVAAAGLAVAGGFAASLEQAALGDKLAAQLGASGEYAENLGQVAGDLYAGAYGDSLGQVNDALASVIQSGAVMEDASNAQLQSVTGSVLDLATAFDKDVGETSQAVGRLIQTGLAANAEEALDIITRGFQQGADTGGDFLDVLGEYGTTFSELGLSGGVATGLVNQALAAGIPNADFAADALREIGIIGREGGEEAAEAIEALGLSSADYFAAMQAGGPQASAALDQVLDALRNTEDPAARAAAATALVGTQYEDLGDAILQLDPSEAERTLGTIDGAAGRLGETLNDNASTNLTSFMRSAQQAFVDVIGGQVLPIVERVASFLAANLGPTLDTVGSIVTDRVVPPIRDLIGWLAENETVATTLAAIIGGVLVSALIVWGVRSTIAGVQSVVAWVTTAAASTTSAGRQSASALQVVAGWVLMGAQALLGAARVALAWLIALGPIGLVIAAIVGLVTLVVIYFDEIVAAISGAWEWVTSLTSEAWNAAVEATTAGISAVVEFVTGLPDRFLSALSELGAFLGGILASAWTAAAGAVGAGVQWVVDYVVALPGRFLQGLQNIGAMLGEVFGNAWRFASDTVRNGIEGLLGFVGAIPGRIWSVLSGLGSLLVGLGGDLIGGLVNGISNAAGFVGDVGRNVVNSIIGFVNSQVIDRVNNLLEFTVAGITIDPPDIARIPRLHSGGVFDSGQGEGLALLRDDELVVTPEQRGVADDLLRGLLAGNLPGSEGARGSVARPAVTIVENVYAAPGESAASIAARATQGVVWNLNAGITRPAPLGASS